MGEVLWRRWCLCCVCLAVVVAAPRQQAPCEVLDSSGLQSTFPLPTNFTLRSLTQKWQVHFVLQQTGEPPAACVIMEQDRSAVRLTMYSGRCKDGTLLDYSFIEGMTLSPHAWTLFLVEVRDNKVWVAPLGAAPVALRGEGTPLPRGALQVAAVQGLEAAVGCRVNCPHYSRSSGRGSMKTVMTSNQEFFFYFHPGEDFIRLQYEVTCGTLGFKRHPHTTDIKLARSGARGRWHLVELRHRSRETQITLDNELLLSRNLPSMCAFKQHAVRLEGQALFSFCNPASGVEELVKVDPMTQCAGNTWSVTDQITVALVAVVVLLLAYHWGMQRARRRVVTPCDNCPFCKHKTE